MKMKRKQLLRNIEQYREWLECIQTTCEHKADALVRFNQIFPPRKPIHPTSPRVEYQIIIDNKACVFVSDNGATAREVTEGLNDVMPDGWTCLVLEDGGFSIRVQREGEG